MGEAFYGEGVGGARPEGGWTGVGAGAEAYPGGFQYLNVGMECVGTSMPTAVEARMLTAYATVLPGL